jgi:regulator of sirC expression with transglutaminase-like and TPR domain
MVTVKHCERRFLAEIDSGNPRFSPLRAALALSQAADPERLPSEVLLPLLQGLPELDGRLATLAKPYQKFESLSSYFFDTLGFHAAADGENGLAAVELHAVMVRRRGRSLSLALLYYDLARRLAFPLRPLALPGGVLLGSHWLPRGQVIDPANGALVPLAAARHRVDLVLSGRHLAFQPERLEPLSPRQLLERYLLAMRAVYLAEGREDDALRAADWRVRLAPQSAAARWDRGLLLYGMDRYADADRDLGGLLGRSSQREPEEADARAARAEVNRLLASLGRPQAAPGP